MKIVVLLLSIIGILATSSCVLREAKPNAKQEVFLFTDNLTDVDSSLIKEFEKVNKCNVRIVYLTPEEYLIKVKNNRYNTGADVLWFSNDSVKDQLYSSNMIQPIQSNEFAELENEFYVKHQLWYPICHDPLVLTKPKDSSDCNNINFNYWHKKDSISPRFMYSNIPFKYRYQIESTDLKNILIPSKDRKLSNETVWNLSALAKKTMEVDTNFNKNKYFCKQLISVKRKHITKLSCLYIAKYARNLKNANKLVTWMISHKKQIASKRNQLSCAKNTTPNYTIEQMSLFF